MSYSFACSAGLPEEYKGAVVGSAELLIDECGFFVFRDKEFPSVEAAEAAIEAIRPDMRPREQLGYRFSLLKAR